MITHITVPRTNKEALEALVPSESWDTMIAPTRKEKEAEMRWPAARAPRFSATVAFGSRLEPRITLVQVTSEAGP